jgi:hypothetical protein
MTRRLPSAPHKVDIGSQPQAGQRNNYLRFLCFAVTIGLGLVAVFHALLVGIFGVEAVDPTAERLRLGDTARVGATFMFFGARIGRRRREYHHYTSAHDERRYRDFLFHARNPSQSAQFVEKKIRAESG